MKKPGFFAPTERLHLSYNKKSSLVPSQGGFDTCHSELCHDAAASLVVQETCHSEPEHSGGEESRRFLRNEILRRAQDDMYQNEPDRLLLSPQLARDDNPEPDRL